ncbi:MAG: phosphoserine phosphatase SerB [Geminicoccaceae bacterium]|nr:phosphoserine phosphatase SerB [Geminicoccaceae bacterium]
MPVLCLVADPETAPLPAVPLERLAARVGGDVVWLAPGAAAEIRAEGDPTHLRAEAEAALGGLPVDTAILPAAGRRKRLLLADMDSTMITIECIDELAGMAGIKAEIVRITERAMRGELDFFAALEARVARLAGLPATAVDEVIRERLRFMPGAVTLVATMRANGARAVLVSGGFTAFTGHVRRVLGFDADHGNRLEVEGGRLTGRLIPPLLGADAKRETLLSCLDALGLDASASLAVGDGANDRAMLKAAGLGVAFRAHKAAEATADAVVRHGDLTALLYLQGYAKADFVERG